MDEALRLARYGWQEGATQARQLRDGITASIPHRSRMTRYAVAGALPNVQRYLAGNPLHMRQMEHKETNQRPIITLACDICNSAIFPAEDMVKQAAATAAVVDLLEDAGFRCELIVVFRAENDPRRNVEIAVRLKAPEQPFDLASAAFGMGHPLMLRRLIFAVAKATPSARGIGSALGMPDRVKSVPEAGTFTVKAAQDTDGNTARERFTAICQHLRQLGCPGIPTQEALRAA